MLDPQFEREQGVLFDQEIGDNPIVSSLDYVEESVALKPELALPPMLAHCRFLNADDFLRSQMATRRLQFHVLLISIHLRTSAI